MPETVIIGARFRGPPESANGGYACGVVAGLVGGPAEVTLRKPPPLDTELGVDRRADGGVALRAGDLLIAEGKPAQVDLAPPAPPAYAEAEEASRRYPGFEMHPFPSCFVCGPERAEGDGLRIFPGALGERTVAAAPFTVDASLAGADGLVRPEVVWAALDCPSYFGALADRGGPVMALLGRLSARILAPLRAGERYLAVGWLRACMPDFEEIVCGGGTLDHAYAFFVRKGRELEQRPIEPLVIKDPIVLRPEDPVARAATVMVEKQIRRLPVVAEGKLVGTVSRADLCRAVMAEL
jgi:CBS domain-containing protein